MEPKVEPFLAPLNSVLDKLENEAGARAFLTQHTRMGLVRAWPARIRNMDLPKATVAVLVGAEACYEIGVDKRRAGFVVRTAKYRWFYIPLHDNPLLGPAMAQALCSFLVGNPPPKSSRDAFDAWTTHLVDA
jgi:hypothetical protein